MLYTAMKPFVFRGYQFNPGDKFDTEAVQCDSHRARVLMNQRYIEPGYNAENAVLSNKNKKAEPKPTPAPEAKNEPDPAQDEGDTENEPESDPENGEDSGEQAEAPKRHSKRRS